MFERALKIQRDFLEKLKIQNNNSSNKKSKN
jgi:hypothetical protein